MKNKVLSTLPVTRKAHFKDSIKNRWRLLLKCTLALAIGFLPIFICFLLRNIFISNIYLNADEITSEIKNMVLIINLSNLLAISVLSFVFSLALSGVCYIVKKICWSEGVQFFYCFKEGIKQNYKNTCLIIFLMFLLFDINALAFYFSINVIAFVIILSISLFVVFPFLLTGLIYSSIYIVNAKQFLKNVSILMFKSYFFSLGMTVLIVGVTALSFIIIVNPLLNIILWAICSLFVIYLVLLIYEYYLNVFDLLINSKIHKELFRKGLY